MTDIDLKTLTPDTSLPTTGFLFGADSQATASPSVYSTQTVATTLLGSTSLTGGPALTADAPVLNLSQTWNNVAVTFTGIKYNTTNTNSAAASKLMDLQVDGNSKFAITKSGRVQANPSNTAPYGSASDPDFKFAGSASGIFGSAANLIDFAANGVRAGGFTDAAEFYISVPDPYLTRRGPANFRFGRADAASPVAQTLSVQSVVAGTSNTAGAAFTVTGSQGTGTGAGGSIIFQVATTGSSDSFTVTFTNGSATISGTGLPTGAGTEVAFTTTGALPTNFAINTTYFVLAGSTSTAITVAATAGGTAIVAGSAGSGTQTLTQALAQNTLVDAVTISAPSAVPFLRWANTNAYMKAADANSFLIGDFNSGSSTINFGLVVRPVGGLTYTLGAAIGIGIGAAPNSLDVFMVRDNADILAQRNGTTSQAFRVYNTYTDASNYERGVFDWKTTANQLTIGTERAGTGSSRILRFVVGGTRIAISDGSYLQVDVDFIPTQNIIMAAKYTEMTEMTAPAAPAANKVRFYAEDNGSGKTRLMALFATGAAQQIAIEP